MKKSVIRVYTDGSCHTQLLLGSWAAILFIDKEKVILQGNETLTTHNRMELMAVIKAIDYLNERKLQDCKIEIYSDSQYVVTITTRMEKLKHKNFITNKGTNIQNIDLVKQLIEQIETHNLEFIKLKAHQKEGDVINREVDGIVRNSVRKQVLNHE